MSNGQQLAESEKGSIIKVLEVNKNVLSAIGIFLLLIRFSQDHIKISDLVLPVKSIEDLQFLLTVSAYSLLLFVSYFIVMLLFTEFVSNLAQNEDKSMNLKFFEIAITTVIILIFIIFFIEYIFIMRVYLSEFAKITNHHLHALVYYFQVLIFPFICVVITIYLSKIINDKYFKGSNYPLIKKHGFNSILILGLSLSVMITAYVLK